MSARIRLSALPAELEARVRADLEIAADVASVDEPTLARWGRSLGTAPMRQLLGALARLEREPSATQEPRVPEAVKGESSGTIHFDVGTHHVALRRAIGERGNTYKIFLDGAPARDVHGAALTIPDDGQHTNVRAALTRLDEHLPGWRGSRR
jgi:hypothetical protein